MTGGVEATWPALSALVVSVVSAVTQVVPIEAYLAALGLVAGGAGTWVVAALAGLGHALGKLVWYEVGRAAHSWERYRRWLERPRVRASYARWLRAFADRPRLVLLMLAASAVVGVPPLAVTPTVAGHLGVGRWSTFAVIGLGRTLRFAAVLGAVGLVA